MTKSLSPPKETEVFWHIVLDRKTGKFLNRMCVSLIDARLANEMHFRMKDGIELYLEKDAINFFPSTHPLSFKP